MHGLLVLPPTEYLSLFKDYEIPRAVLLVLSQAPDARHLGRYGPQDSVEVHRCSSWTRFSPCPLLSYVCLDPDGGYTVVFPQLQFITIVDDAFTLCPFHCRQARVARRHARLGPFLVVQFLDKLFSPVVVLRQVPILSIYVDGSVT